ncbi:MAG: DUF4442 domain-containing protein [Gemmatimonadota bacterium]|nr:DUF4442 domain-containing protein [Gemmatimonadota bacterium]
MSGPWPDPPSETWRARLRRWGLNLFPAYRGTGARLTWLAEDWSEVRIRLPLSWRTRNYVGTIYGGSMYAAVDPIWMVMLIERLGDEYVVWNKRGAIRFRRPGRETLCARFVMEDAEVAAIRSALEKVAGSIERSYEVDLVDSEGEPHATVSMTLHVRGDGGEG